jgi:hypothetical protein
MVTERENRQKIHRRLNGREEGKTPQRKRMTKMQMDGMRGTHGGANINGTNGDIGGCNG